MGDCYIHLAGLALISVSLLFSMCLNVILCIRRRAILCRDTDECCDPSIDNGERLSQSEAHCFHNLNHHKQQANPIYGNISRGRRGSLDVSYEMMQRTRDCMKSSKPDLNYASLELKVANKQKKKRRNQQGQTQGRSRLQNRLSVPPGNSFFEVERDMDSQLPPRDASAMNSHSSIYLNSQQIAQETVDTERGRGMSGERGNEWRGEQGREERQDSSNGCVRQHLSVADAVQSDADHCISSSSHDGGRQD